MVCETYCTLETSRGVARRYLKNKLYRVYNQETPGVTKARFAMGNRGWIVMITSCRVTTKGPLKKSSLKKKKEEIGGGGG